MTKEYENTGIYSITGPSGNKYIGSSVNIKRRWDQHKTHLRCGKHHSKALQSVSDKYGIEGLNFEIILICDKENLFLYEQLCLDYLKPKYNSAKIAGSTVGVPCGNEARKKLSKSMKGVPKSEEHRKKIGDANRGKTRSKEFRERASEIMRNRPPMSEYTRKKIGDASRKRGISKEARKKIGEARRGDKHPMARQVVCLETGDTFSTMKYAAQWLNSMGFHKAKGSDISAVVRGRKKSAYGHTWRLVEMEGNK